VLGAVVVHLQTDALLPELDPDALDLEARTLAFAVLPAPAAVHLAVKAAFGAALCRDGFQVGRAVAGDAVEITIRGQAP
jgi:hypothetical protein